jgi:cysteine desulfurase
MEPVYLDHAATTPVAREVLDTMVPYLRHHWGNPSSSHTAGRVAREAVEEARERVAAALGCAPREIVFTSGGSEADNLALRGVLERAGGSARHLVITAIEHDAVLKTAERLLESERTDLALVGCDQRGMVDPEKVAAAVGESTVLVSVMLANNEVGTIQDVAAVVEGVKRKNPRTVVHTDAVQALGKLPIDVPALGVDLLSVSAHKVYGPKGCGALYVRQGVLLDAQITGGGQERNRRSGTENVAGVAGFGAAASLAEEEREAEMPRLATLASRLTELITTAVPGTCVTGEGAPRLPTFATFAFSGVETQLLLTILDGEGVQASGGSACASGAAMPSHVLVAMGLPTHLCAGALRCTLGRGTSDADITRAAAVITRAVEQLRSASGGGPQRREVPVSTPE